MVVAVAKETFEQPRSNVPIYDARDLAKGGDLSHIQLDGQTYVLRITRAGKLILTK